MIPSMVNGFIGLCRGTDTVSPLFFIIVCFVSRSTLKPAFSNALTARLQLTPGTLGVI